MKILFCLLSVFSFLTSYAQPTLKLELHVDSCSYYKNSLVSQDTSYTIAFTGRTDTVSLLKRDNTEIGIKIYANQIIEEKDTMIIVRYIFFNREDNRWYKISEGEYIPLHDLINVRSLKVGGEDERPRFYIQYYFLIKEPSRRK